MAPLCSERHIRIRDLFREFGSTGRPTSIFGLLHSGEVLQ